MNFLKLIRFPNLVIIALTQYAIRYGIIYPFLKQSGLGLFLSEQLFALLVIGTVFIAASGYIINDYFDVKLDAVNKPKQLIIGKYMTRRQAMFLHFLIQGIGLLCAGYVAISIHHPFLILFQLVSAALLWFYSVNFKKQVLIGNFIISALTALVPFTAGYYEIAVMYDSVQLDTLNSPFDASSLRSLLFNIKYILYWVSGYSAFSFLLTLIREIIKDCEDIEGDKAFSCRTLPIVYGIKKAKTIAVYVSLFLMLLIAIVEGIQWVSKDWLSLAYFLILINLPLIWVVLKIRKAKNKKDFFFISQSVKILMLIGIIYTGIIYYS